MNLQNKLTVRSKSVPIPRNSYLTKMLQKLLLVEKMEQVRKDELALEGAHIHFFELKQKAERKDRSKSLLIKK